MRKISLSREFGVLIGDFGTWVSLILKDGRGWGLKMIDWAWEVTKIRAKKITKDTALVIFFSKSPRWQIRKREIEFVCFQHVSAFSFW